MSNLLSKNAIWAALASFIAAVCLITALYRYEARSEVSLKQLDRAVDHLVASSISKVQEQDRAGQQLVNALAYDLYGLNRDIHRKCDEIDRRVRRGLCD